MLHSAAISALNRTRGICLVRGLLGTPHTSFHTGQALWIVPCRGVRTLAMHYPLDLIYLDRSGYVVDLQAGVKPWRFAPVHLRAASVLELPVGVIRKNGTLVGDQVEIVPANLPEELAA